MHRLFYAEKNDGHWQLIRSLHGNISCVVKIKYTVSEKINISQYICADDVCLLGDTAYETRVMINITNNVASEEIYHLQLKRTVAINLKSKRPNQPIYSWLNTSEKSRFCTTPGCP